MTSDAVDAPRRNTYSPPVTTRRVSHSVGTAPTRMPPFLAGPATAGVTLDEELDAGASAAGQYVHTAPLEPTGREAALALEPREEPAPSDGGDWAPVVEGAVALAGGEPTGEWHVEPVRTHGDEDAVETAAGEPFRDVDTGEEAAAVDVSSVVEPDAAEEPVPAAAWEPETLDDVWDPTDQAEPTAAADDAAEWPDAEPMTAARPAWGPDYAAAMAQHPGETEQELGLVAERVAERLEDLAQDVRRRGLVALGAGLPADEQLKLDELSKLIAAVVAGFYAREE